MPLLIKAARANRIVFHNVSEVQPHKCVWLVLCKVKVISSCNVGLVVVAIDTTVCFLLFGGLQLCL